MRAAREVVRRLKLNIPSMNYNEDEVRALLRCEHQSRLQTGLHTELRS